MSSTTGETKVVSLYQSQKKIYAKSVTGRFANLILAVLVFMIYSNLVSMSQAWIAQGKLDPRVGTWVVHAVMLSVLALLLSWRLGKWRGLFRR